MKVLAFQGSPRPQGNSTLMLDEFIRSAQETGAEVTLIDAHKINIKPCRGCLKCNMRKRCIIRNDDWTRLAEQIQQADCLVFASPIYFHHLPGPLKIIVDRFRSFMHVKITETGLQHTPWQSWSKRLVGLFALGSSVPNDAQAVIDLFQFIANELGADNSFTSLIGTRLAIARQIEMSHDELLQLYPKLGLPTHLVDVDFERNQQLLKACFELGKNLTN